MGPVSRCGPGAGRVCVCHDDELRLECLRRYPTKTADFSKQLPRDPPSTRFTGSMAVTIYGVCVVSFMMIMYGLEHRGRGFVLAFALGCILSSVYGFLSGAWPFGIVELIWSGVALRRYRETVPT